MEIVDFNTYNKQIRAFSAFRKVPLKMAISFDRLYQDLLYWRNTNPDITRLDGRKSSQANPSQYVYFSIDRFNQTDFLGQEDGIDITGLKWNGMYYLAGSVTSSSIDVFLDKYNKNSGNVSNIFELSYTSGRCGDPQKRRLFLRNSTETINKGWICKQLS